MKVNKACCAGNWNSFFALCASGVFVYDIDGSSGKWMLENKAVDAIVSYGGGSRMIFAGGKFGLIRSSDGGSNWDRIKRFSDIRVVEIRIANYSPTVTSIWLATEKELFASIDTGNNWTKKFSFSDETSILNIKFASPAGRYIFLETTGGILRFNIDTEKFVWLFKDSRISDVYKASEEYQEESSETHISQFACLGENSFLLSHNMLLRLSDENAGWNLIRMPVIGTEKLKGIFSVGQNPGIFTRKDIFLSDNNATQWIRIYQEENNVNINHIIELPGSPPRLLISTDSGIHIAEIPCKTVQESETAAGSVENGSFAGYYSPPPDIREIQQMAIKYNDLSPSKIIDWRKASKRSAFMPEISFSVDMDCQSNIDLDRGSTNDPDMYIIGPQEKSIGWNISCEWDLSRAVFNSDIISLELRAKYLAELREDIISRVTRLYYERERIINELKYTNNLTALEASDKKIQIRELESYLDVLTGGGFSNILHLEDCQNR